MKQVFAINNGVIDKDAFHLLGASSKRDDESKIGYFGSGLKYSLAWLLRNNIDFKVFSNAKEIKFGTIKKDFRGRSFDVITVNGHETSLTTDLGPDWTSWFALREVICNALDEEKGTYGVSEVPMIPQKDMTFFLINYDKKFEDFFDNQDLYFSFKRKDSLCTVKDGSIFPSLDDKLSVYRKGVRCYHFDKHAVFNYDFNKIEINESRVIEDTYGLRYRVFDMINDSDVFTKETFLEKLKADSYEWDLHTLWNSKANPNWLEALEGKLVVPPWVSHKVLTSRDFSDIQILPIYLYEFLEKAFGKQLNTPKNVSANRVVLEATSRQKRLVEESKARLKEAGFEISAPISIAAFRETNMMGQAENGEIYVSGVVADAGGFELDSTLLEEHFHLVSGQSDETRGFQDYVLKTLLLELMKSRDI